MDSRFFERKCFTTTSDCLLEFMKEQKDDSSLIFNMEEDTKEVFLYSPAFDVEYNEDDIMDCVGRELGVEINNLFVDGDKYCATIYFTVSIMKIKSADNSDLLKRLDEIDGELQDFHISAYKCDLLYKEQNDLKAELRQRGYKINPDGKEKGTDNNLLAKTSFDKFKQEMIEEFGEKE